MLKQLQHILHTSNCSCVIANGDKIESFHQRGIKDLYELLRSNRSLLEGATIADKVVGRGAAALMIAGGVKTVYADVISEPAVELFDKYEIKVEYDKKVVNIINRQGDGICPVEQRCTKCNTIEECLQEIDDFVKTIKH